MGIIQGPEEFADGVAAGFKSLASNVLGGTADALGRIGNRLGTGVAALTVDDKFQKERRERINRKVGFGENSRNLFRGFLSGVTGVITKPIEGAQQEGVEGLFKGVGRGVVGIVAQPATGVIDFASGSLQAFNNIIDTKQMVKQVRPPRMFRARHELSPYNSNMAKGNQMLKILSEGKYADQEFEFHCLVSRGTMVLVTKESLFCLKKSFISCMWEVDWCEPWTNCTGVQLDDHNKLHIKTKVSFGW